MCLILFTWMTSTLELYIAAENVWTDVSLALEHSSLLKHAYQNAFQRVCQWSAYHNTEVMEKLAADELVRVVLVRWEQFT